MTAKIICTECNWHGTQAEVLTAQHPFDESDMVQGCPRCLSVDSMVVACEHDGCWKVVSCGNPLADGSYAQTCGEHQPPKELRKPPYNK